MITRAFRALRVPSCVTDLKGKILETNPAFCRLVQKTAIELSGANHHDLVLRDEPSASGCLDFENKLQTGPDWSCLRCYQCGDTQIWVELHISGLREGDSYTEVLIQAHDVTEQTQLKKEIEERQRELEQFVSISSHDLREPLNSMAGLATLLKRRYGTCLDETGKRWLDEMCNVAKQTDRKIDALLSLSRASREMPKGHFYLGSAIEEAERSLTLMIQESQTRISVDLSEGNPTFYGDRSMIAEVFQNLFSNAIKYSKSAPQITVSARPAGRDLWCISVADNGLGFDMKFKDRIFKVFQRLYTLAEYPGTGMGLAIAKKIVERHRGTIWAESEPGEGTTFFFTLPVTAQ